VYLAPQGDDLEFSVTRTPAADDQTASTHVPVVAGHQMVVFEP
jgi:hypothetical protein